MGHMPGDQTAPAVTPGGLTDEPGFKRDPPVPKDSEWDGAVGSDSLPGHPFGYHA